MNRRHFLSGILAVGFLAPTVIAAPSISKEELDNKAFAKTIQFGIPIPVSVSWNELVVEVPISINPVGIGGRVKSIAFSDFRLNGIPFELDPYTASFDLPEKETLHLPEPLRMRVRFTRIAPGVLEEALMPSNRLHLSGVVTVDGSFKKWFLTIDRAVDVPVEVTTENPIADYHPLKYALAKLRELESRGWTLPF